jgi:hypothetical protein
VYAGATGGLAAVTAWGVRTSDRASRANNQTNIEAAASALTRQIEATQAITARQIQAAEEAGRQQALLSAVSLNRQGWINQLRDEVAGFVAENALRRGLGERIKETVPQLQGTGPHPFRQGTPFQEGRAAHQRAREAEQRAT